MARGSARPVTNGDGTASIGGTSWEYARAEHNTDSTNMYAETRIDAIDAALDLLKYGPPGLARPPRGNRDGHPTTRIIMELSNRHAALRREADAATISGGDNWRAMHPSAKA